MAGILHSARNLLASAAGLLRTRLELLGIELQEELARLATALIGAVVLSVLLLLGLAFAAVALLLAVGEAHRLAVAIGAAAFFLGSAGIGALIVRRATAAPGRLFGASLAELERDCESLKP
ncbi:MAG: phage holin family protein [Betaproteobacteria bacterium]|nr:phage holin family protein [Betaproteobacteria bacterium]